ncbi:lipopolysaccharide transport periplasmic protein LptA [Rudaea sp.]|uniref:lipopolysaccharide transport periplasmic protein LptA n=1 Tax=Rudaea sp. TaxID=2136325 RepID=UPI00321FEB4C
MRMGNVIAAGSVAALLLAGHAFALKSDKDQRSTVEADYSKFVQSKTGAVGDPDVYDLDGNVVITRGSIKMTSAHATLYKIPSAANSPNAGETSRVVLTGKQAHMQQVHDGDCALMTANADKIDYNPLTSLADLTGSVVVIQQGRGEFRGEHMIYNTDTGDMESGNKAEPSGRVHLVMEAKAQAPAQSPNNCGFPGGAGKPAAAKPLDKPAEAKPQPKQAKPAVKPAADKSDGGAH